MTTPELTLTEGVPEDVAAGQQRLAAGLRRVRRATGGVATERWLAVAGGVLMPLGVLLVLAGWYGAAHTTRLFEEIPYLISGGMLGIVLAAIGASLYFGYWLTRLVSHARELVDGMARIERRLESLAPGEVGADTGRLVATREGVLFHRADCSVVASRPASELRTVKLPAAGLSPCKLCAPLAGRAG
jgi:hypothetical protein